MNSNSGTAVLPVLQQQSVRHRWLPTCGKAGAQASFARGEVYFARDCRTPRRQRTSPPRYFPRAQPHYGRDHLAASRRVAPHCWIKGGWPLAAAPGWGCKKKHSSRLEEEAAGAWAEKQLEELLEPEDIPLEPKLPEELLELSELPELQLEN